MPAIFTTEATVSKNKIQIEIHGDIYNHIGQYLATGDYFHAVEESYKLVRGKLREITGKEKASDVFNNSAQNTAHYEALFGKATPSNDAEADFSEVSDTYTWVSSISETRRPTRRQHLSNPTLPCTTSRWRASPTT
ncbi:TIGR02391 family protein [Micromonospora sp. M12]